VVYRRRPGQEVAVLAMNALRAAQIRSAGLSCELRPCQAMERYGKTPATYTRSVELNP
jgi:hypothetical protein